MAATKDQILESISNMTVMEVVELISEMEEKFQTYALVSGASGITLSDNYLSNPQGSI